MPKQYENPAYIHGIANKPLDNPQKIYNQPVIIDGEDNSVIFLFSEVFNDDVLIRTGNSALFIYAGNCEFNGHVYFENDILQAGENTVLPLFVTDFNGYSVEVLHGSAAYILLKKDAYGCFNGKEYRYDDAADFGDLSEYYDAFHFSSSPDKPDMHFIRQRTQNGEVFIEHRKTNVDVAEFLKHYGLSQAPF